jgi:sn-glycerol 3-phosphate transport system substrate-binding protein
MGMAMLIVSAACGREPAVGRAAPGSGGCTASSPAQGSKPVDITMWHFLDDFGGAPTLSAMVADFNRSQAGVRVQLRSFRNDDDLAANYLRLAAAHKSLPDLVQFHGDVTRTAIDENLVVPVQACLDARDEGVSDFLDAALAPTRIGSTQWGLPLGLRVPLFLYDRSAFERAGLDPDRPPATLAEVRSDADRLHAAGVSDPLGLLHVFDLLATSGATYTDADEGHAGRATQPTIDTPTARAVVAWSQQYLDAFPGPPPANATSDLQKLGSGSTAMTIHDSIDFGMTATALAQGQAPGVALGVAPVPALDGRAAIRPYAAGLFLSRGPNVRVAAAWQFLDWLEAPAQQARLHEGSVYFPTRRSAVGDPTLVAYWSRLPLLADAWKVMESARVVPEPLIGPLKEVLSDARIADVLQHKATVDEALSGASARIARNLEAYDRNPLVYASCAVAITARNQPTSDRCGT